MKKKQSILNEIRDRIDEDVKWLHFAMNQFQYYSYHIAEEGIQFQIKYMKIMILYTMKRLAEHGLKLGSLPYLGEEEIYFVMDSYIYDIVGSAEQLEWKFDVYNMESVKNNEHMRLVEDYELEAELQILVLSNERIGRDLDFIVSYPKIKRRKFFKIIQNNWEHFFNPFYYYFNELYESYVFNGTCYVSIGVGYYYGCEECMDIRHISVFYPLFLYYLNCLLDIAETSVPEMKVHTSKQHEKVHLNEIFS